MRKVVGETDIGYVENVCEVGSLDFVPEN